MDAVRVIEGDCLRVLKTLRTSSIDAVITDPPYPEIRRPYGKWTEEEWWELVVEGVIPQVRRVLKPTGSAVFILQPNSRKVGSMRGWLFRFQAWACDNWNMVQDFYWWNTCAAPTVHCQRQRGLARPSVKACVWLGEPDCYRDQNAVLWSESDGNKARDRSDRALKYTPSGGHGRRGRAAAVTDERGGTTPFNLIPVGSSTGSPGHGAGTPLMLARWWTRYLCPPGGRVLDPFFGSGTMGLAALKEGRECIGIERDPGYCAIARKRLEEASCQPYTLST